MKMYRIDAWHYLCLIALIFSAATFQVEAAPQSVIYASPQGNDAWFGKFKNAHDGDGPVASLERARDLIRETKRLHGLPVGGMAVELEAGDYILPNTFSLGADDSGEVGKPIVYRAAVGAIVRVVGGRSVSGFGAITDARVLSRLPPEARSHVLQADLRGQGINDFGKISRRGGLKAMSPSGLELFFRHQPMQLARWPNGSFARISALPDGEQGLRFSVLGDQVARWSDEPDVWAFGYWLEDWADNYEQVTKMDKGIITLGAKPTYGMRLGKRVYFLNLLAELDEPGEWFLDRQAGVIYFWPPEPIRSGDVEVSLLQDLVHLEGTSYLELQGIIF